MAKGSFNNKYVTLDSVRVFYDADTDTIHLTAKDKDFSSTDQFHITLNKDSKTEETLRKVLHKHKVITSEKVKSLPKRVDFSSRDTSNDVYYEIPLGVMRDGSEFKWEVDWSPHIFVCGSTGSGKSILEGTILKYASNFKEEYEVYGIDLKRVELTPYIKNGYIKELATDREQALEILKKVEEKLRDTYKNMDESKVISYKKLSAPPKATIVLVDELFQLTAKVDVTGLSKIEELKEELNREKIIESLKKISRLGRGAGIHLALFSQRLVDPELEEVLSNTSARVIIGKASKSISRDLIGSELAFNTTGVPGRAVFQCGSRVESFQSYYSSGFEK